MPPTAKPSAQEEADFMKNLLADIDVNDFDDYVLSPVKSKTPAKSKPPGKPLTTGQTSFPVRSSDTSIQQTTPCKNKAGRSHKTPNKAKDDTVSVIDDLDMDDFWDYTMSPEKPQHKGKQRSPVKSKPSQVCLSVIVDFPI